MKVTYDARCLRFDGAPQFLLSGSLHYPRTHPSRWPSLFASLKAAGLNAVETYVFWGEHQRTPAPAYDWTGRRDLWGFIAAAGDAGLAVLLRLGPYVCAEAHFGGLPAWLRAVPGIRFRTDNGPFCDAMGDWCRVVARELRSRRLSAADGGPVVAVQLENEYEMVADAYGPGGGRYLDWVGRLGGELDVGVPLLMCLGAPKDGGGDGGGAPVLSTINAFYGHEHLDAHRREHPASPALWTEHWTGWYGVYGAATGVGRPAADLAYGTARFVAAGGAGVNYYMMHGGSNWGRSGMYLSTASYDYDAPLDEAGGRGDKYAHLAALHAALADHWAGPLFLGSDAVPVVDGAPPGAAPGVVVYRWATDAADAAAVAFVCNDGAAAADAPVAADLGGARVGRLAPRSVVLVDTRRGRVLFDTAAPGGVRPAVGGADGGDSGGARLVARPSVRRVRRLVVPPAGGWSWRVAAVEAVPRLGALPERAVVLGAPATSGGEPPPADGGGGAAAAGGGVVDLVSMTGDTSDYCWYVRSVAVPALPAGNADAPGATTATLSVTAADIVHAYVNGAYVGSSPPAGVPLWEDRFPNKWNAYADGRGWPGWTHTISFPWAAAGVPAGAEAVEVALLAVSTGMVKGDWQLGGAANMLDERKGVLSPPTLTLATAGAAPAADGDGDEGGAPAVASCAAEAADPGGAAGWTAVPFLAGEVACVGDAEPHRRRFLGQPLDAPPPPPPTAGAPPPPGSLPTWHTATLTAPAVSDGWFLDLGGLSRGALYVNGHHLARYWTVGGGRPLNGFLDGSPMGVGLATEAVTAGADEGGGGGAAGGGGDGGDDGGGGGGAAVPPPPPTQRYYHVPPWVVADGDGDAEGAVTLRVTILDEVGARPDTVALYDSAMEAVEAAAGDGTSARGPRR